MKRGRVNFVCDGGFGSTGKGKLCGHLAETFDVDVAIVSNGSQAGHTAEKRDGQMVMTQQVPIALAMGLCPVGLIGPGARIDLDILAREVENFKLSSAKLRIHPHAAIIDPRHKDVEALVTKRIASTMKGNGACQADKVLRDFRLQLACHIDWLRPYLDDTAHMLHKVLASGGTVMSEMSQGFGLDLDYGFYPYVTGQHCTPMAEAARIGVSHKDVGDVYMCMRTFPIRVGNVQGGNSGPIYEDQEELTWEQVTEISGSPKPLLERTTVTNRVRRVFSWSQQAFDQAMRHIRPDYIFLNFVNYLDHTLYQQAGHRPMNELGRAETFVRSLYTETMLRDARLTMLGTGPGRSDMLFLR